MRKVLKWTGIIISGILLLVVIAGIITNEARPEGEAGPAADALARKMLKAVNEEAWDTTTFVEWSFMGMHHYLWDKDREAVRVRWSDKEVLLHTKTVSGLAYENGRQLSGEQSKALVDKAWEFFCNDSFWLNAVVKAFDPGTTRSLVQLKDGRTGLMVHYESGGVTPGDSYLWVLSESGLPEKWKMWVSVLPIGGLSASWEGWTTLSTGAKVATIHRLGPFSLEMGDVRGSNTLSDLGVMEDPFADLCRSVACQ